MMKKTKVLLLVLVITVMSIIPISCVNAHSVELDPDSMISFPFWVTGGEGKLTIYNAEEGYALYYQAVEIPNNDYTRMEELQENGETTLESIDEELDVLDAECENLKTIYDEAYEGYEAKKTAGATEEEIATAKTAYETARENYLNKVEEYNNKVEEYNNTVSEINQQIKELIPVYIENNWIQTSDGSFKVDTTQFSGERAYVIWAKLVTVDGTIVYDEAIYTMSGTKEEDIAVESITLNETTVSITEGHTYTIVATVSPVDATNKNVIWTSSDENVATVEDGKITAISEGTATITAKTEDGEYTATCVVTVTKDGTTPPVEDVQPEEPDGKEDPEELPDTLPGDLPQTGELSHIVKLALIVLGVLGSIAYIKVRKIQLK